MLVPKLPYAQNWEYEAPQTMDTIWDYLLSLGGARRKLFSFLKIGYGANYITGTKSLSRAGKEVLLKTVAQALPTYTMNVLLLLIGVCRDIEKMFNSFWWGQKR